MEEMQEFAATAAFREHTDAMNAAFLNSSMKWKNLELAVVIKKPVT